MLFLFSGAVDGRKVHLILLQDFDQNQSTRKASFSIFNRNNLETKTLWKASEAIKLSGYAKILFQEIVSSCGVSKWNVLS